MAKNIIFYFSGTGNSLIAARRIAQVVDNTEIAPIPGHFGADLSAYERIGFVYPIYYVGVPLIVKRFVESIDIPAGSYLFAIATYGGRSGNGLTELSALLSAKGHGLDFCSCLQMPGNYILLYGKKENADGLNAAATTVLPEIALAIRNKEKRFCVKKNPFYSLATNIFRRSVHKTAQKFTVSKDCTSCGLCAKVCPVGNICLKEGKPAFSVNCEQCMACIQFCPQQAINYQDKTQKRTRYHHPDITAADMIQERNT